MAAEARPKGIDDFGDILTVKDMAELLQASQRTIYRMVDRDELPAVKIGQKLYFPKPLIRQVLMLDEAVAP